MTSFAKFDITLILIGQSFYMNGRKFLCTDKGSRVLVGVEIDERAECDPSWLAGPPYAFAELVFDEDDLELVSIDAPDSGRMQGRQKP
jgi:hypothetical protein